jgi:RES domain-containing protein
VAYRPWQELLKRLEALETGIWDGLAWRHMFADNPPTRVNESGARWNPPGVPAIYCSLDRTTALAEGDYALSAQPLTPTVKRTVYNLRVHLEKVLDLSSPSILLGLGVGETELSNVDHAGMVSPCSRVESELRTGSWQYGGGPWP